MFPSAAFIQKIKKKNELGSYKAFWKAIWKYLYSVH